MSAPLLSPSPSPRRLATDDSTTEGNLLLKQQSVPKWETPGGLLPEIATRESTAPSIFSRSLYLRPYFLTGLGVVFLSFVVVLEVLRYLSDANQGFVSSDEGKHYLWTYGPTFILSVVAAVWGQVEYRILQATPWLELKRRPLPAERNLLMNYVSPWSVTTLFRALPAGHFAVSLVVLGGLLLKALIIVSTGLIDLEVKQITYDTQFSVTNQFNLSRLPSQTPVNPADPKVALWAFVQGAGSVRYPAGTTPEYAILSAAPDIVDSGSGVTFSSETPVFSVEQACTSFSWTFNSTRGTNTSLSDVITSKEELDLLSQYCLIEVWYLPRTLFANDTKKPLLTSRDLRFPVLNRTTFVDTKCRQSTREPLRDSTRVFTSVLVPLQGNNMYTLSALLCLPQYSVTKRRVTTSPGDNVLDVSRDIIETIEVGDLASAAGELTNDVLLAGEGIKLVTNYSTNSWIDVMNFTTPRPDYRDFTNTTLLSKAFQESFRAIAALTVRFQKTVPAERVQSVPGTVTLSIHRLTVTPVSIRVMEALLIAMAVITLVLCVLHLGPRYEPAPTLMDTALILSRSDRLSQTLSLNIGNQPTAKTLTTKLKGNLFYSTHNTTTTIQVQDHVPILDKESPKTEEAKWWLPMAASRTYAALLVATTLLAIIALEVLYQVSKRNGGLAEVPTTGYTRYVWLFLPTLLMASIGLAYVAMDKAMQTLHPFLELSKGEGTRDTLEFEPRSSLALVALAQALRRHFFGLSAMILTSVLGGVLAIAASGLYTTTPFLDTGGITLESKSWFDISTLGQSTRSEVWGGVAEEDVFPPAFQFNNLSLPPGMYGEFAFALPDAASMQVYHKDSDPPAKFIARVPAARVQPNCSLHEFRESFDDKEEEGPSVLTSPPAGCVNGPGGVPIDGAKIFLSNPDLDRAGYVGFKPPALWIYAPGPGLFNASNGDYANTTLARPLCLDDTRHDFFLYGYRNGTVTNNLTIIRCTPYTEALDVEATFHFPNFTVDETAAPPRPAVGSVTTPWTSANKSLNSIERLSIVVLGRDNNLDDFFMVITRGRNGIPMSSLAPPDSLAAMLARITTVYQEMVAINMHFAFRAPLDGTDVQGRPIPGPIQGTLRTELPIGRARLVQSSLSTRLLEGLLAALVICSGVSWWLVSKGTDNTKRRELLPLDPGSVGARMALLAGSGLVEKLGREGVRGLEGERLALGWWGNLEGEKRYGIDIVPG